MQVYLVRVALPDRPGSLGAVASAMGQAGADIEAIEIVERYEGFAIDDFMVELPGGIAADSLITACESEPGVEVVWLSHYPEAWGLQADIDVLNAMSDDPDHADQILTFQAPAVFRVSWAVLVDATNQAVVCGSEMAPELDAAGISALGDLQTSRTAELPDAWIPGWSETLIAVAPTRANTTIVLARRGGPEFIKSELARLRHLAAMTL